MNENISKDEISLKELIEKAKEWFFYLLSKWKLIVVMSVIGAVLGLAYSFTVKPKYTATLTFVLEEESRGGMGGALSLASSFGFNFGGGGGGIFTETNLIDFFKSRSMVEKALLAPVQYKENTISFAEMYIQQNELREIWNKNPKLKRIQFLANSNRKKFTRVHDSILGKIYESILGQSLSVVKEDNKTDIITMKMISENEQFSKLFTEALAKEVSNFYIETKSKKAKANLVILQRQTDSIRGQLNSAITGVAVANDNTFGLNPALNVKRVPSARRQVDVQANTAMLTELVKQTELAKVMLRKETPLIQIIDTPIYPLKKEKFGKSKGIISGGFLAGFLCILYLIFRQVFGNFT